MFKKPLVISETLIKKISQGDRNAFRAFYDSTYPAIYHFIHYFLSDKNDCEEVVSEVFYIIWKKRETLSSINDLKPWLYIVCRNESYHYIKQRDGYRNISIDDVSVELSMDPSSIDGEIIEKEMLDIYNAAVAELPERCKLVFLMVREQQLKYKEIANILSITEGTVEQQMNIAIRKVVSVVKQYYPFIKANRKQNKS
ncbi:RNA polymerase sigma-70 factor (family 1) [Parabacteroides sp. PF5-5]|uniref:RNA polymerase sigma factor n=1 Tax=unclassified Parabacteroides TaxID=2649774 RepID=UPI002475AE96|nr:MULTISPECIES: RNA polymerase sigma-70 factor [unclassified Parabacteroides]MDH6306258.1 RNA polymerase sigma-70 factor (family 1) [Parabacteroides sp. PH5-39]MDH6316950.1 RNA polymerase sigma-70 factor (family 1) [Parabacteroides sp. PF5-13]MDH6321020.1 RNA polymerase sigma-70 factor (family 1) [Parabacteroides sp. PH5-13]MDH6324752.1 RNA polymerase sigma-70 factor (family 1) [Parabacteroides sp. PH5-8]MDH6328135.1 RNA polymerase sigma-70 factor (family 1) [Parabacteroides sp. PH5-41]